MQPSHVEKHPVDIFAGKRLRIIRLCAGYDEDQLGAKAGYTGQRIKAFENATKRMAIPDLLRLANVLDTKVMSFFEGYEGFRQLMGLQQLATDATEEIEDSEARRETQRLIELVFQFTSEQRRSALHFIELMFQKDEPPQGEEP